MVEPEPPVEPEPVMEEPEPYVEPEPVAEEPEPYVEPVVAEEAPPAEEATPPVEDAALVEDAPPAEEPVVEEPVVQEPVAEVKPVVEEESVKKLKAWVQPDYTDVAALVAGLPEGPYDTYADIAVEANRWKEIRASKRAFRESPWKTTAFSAVLKIAFEFGIVYGVRGRWFIKRDPKIVLTPLDGVKAEPKNGHAVPALPPPPPAPVKVEPEVKHEPEMTSFQIDIPKSLLDTLAAIHLEGVVKGAMKADGLKAARSHGLIADSTWLPAARTEIIGILRFNLGESRIS